MSVKESVPVNIKNENKTGPGIDRRGFLGSLGVAGAATLGLSVPNKAEAKRADEEEPYGLLIDTTACAGCRNCEVVCAEAHDLPVPDVDDESVFDKVRNTSETQWSVVNRFETDAGEVFVKKQCMHCGQPGCASACLTRAMLKTKEGPVVWRENKCMGCRFCMISCPFNVPKFEYDSANPRIQKCDLCFDRLEEGQQPRCVEECPAEALTFGKRSALIKEARRRIHESPDDYYDHIYGEREAGGTSVLYLAGVPFEQLGFKTEISAEAYPRYSAPFLYGVPVVLTLMPPLLIAISQATKRDDEEEGGNHG